AGTLNFFDKHKLYGRYWGSFKDFKFLHFELCYYLNIDFAIANQLKVVEAGAQGQHKIPRGFVPEKIYSSFNFFNQNHQKIIENYFEEEKDLNNRQIEELKKLLPFKK
ncbi:MAG: peptidogalycan biosysnthesis protein, partial [Bacteriovoracaceae bacterium]